MTIRDVSMTSYSNFASHKLKIRQFSVLVQILVRAEIWYRSQFLDADSKF